MVSSIPEYPQVMCLRRGVMFGVPILLMHGKWKVCKYQHLIPNSKTFI